MVLDIFSPHHRAQLASGMRWKWVQEAERPLRECSCAVQIQLTLRPIFLWPTSVLCICKHFSVRRE